MRFSKLIYFITILMPLSPNVIIKGWTNFAVNQISTVLNRRRNKVFSAFAMKGFEMSSTVFLLSKVLAQSKEIL